jgi:ribosomal protein L7Ae-like RNA K-turn-binding protein
MSVILRQLIKLLERNNATLSITTDTDPPEIVLSSPEHRDEKGLIVFYATTYRLGRQCPLPASQQTDLLDQ